MVGSGSIIINQRLDFNVKFGKLLIKTRSFLCIVENIAKQFLKIVLSFENLILEKYKIANNPCFSLFKNLK